MCIVNDVVCVLLAGAKSYMVRGEEKIMEELYTKGPVEAAFTVYADFLAYKTGMFLCSVAQRSFLFSLNLNILR
jgi:hypothetical protein